MSFLSDLAMAHRKHEGWYPGSLSQRNNNPGNLRLTERQSRIFGATKGDGGFARFPSYELGFAALLDDLRAKLTGGSSFINYAKNPTFLDYVRIYAPAEDGNNPHSYANSLIRDLQQYHITLSTPLSELARLVNPSQETTLQKANQLPEPVRTRLLRRIANMLPSATRDRLLERLQLPPTL